MAKESSAAPDIDLNDEKTRDFGDSTPFLPYGDGRYTVRLCAFLFHDGYKGRAYRAKVKVLTSDRDDVKVGYQYVTQFKLSEDKLKKEIMAKQMRQFLAAAHDQDPSDESFDANKARADLIELSSHEVLEEADMQLVITMRESLAVDKDTKKPKLDKDGVQKKYTNPYYDAVKEKIAA